MPKMKSSRTLMKRIKVTGTGKIKHKHAYTGHLAPNKTRKQKRNMRGTKVLGSAGQTRTVRSMLTA